MGTWRLARARNPAQYPDFYLSNFGFPENIDFGFPETKNYVIVDLLYRNSPGDFNQKLNVPPGDLNQIARFMHIVVFV